jgi:hypothetical protein
MQKRPNEVQVELVDGLKLYIGGKHGYMRVRGNQGMNKDGFQGYTIDKKRTTKTFKTAKEAAVALAQLEQNLQHGPVSTETGEQTRKKRASRTAGVRHYPPCPVATALPVQLIDHSTRNHTESNETPMPVGKLPMPTMRGGCTPSPTLQWMPLQAIEPASSNAGKPLHALPHASARVAHAGLTAAQLALKLALASAGVTSMR